MSFRQSPRRLAENELLDYALRALSARALSRAELRQKLLTRAAHESFADAVIAKLEEYRYLDDKKFAEMYTVARKDSDGLGKARVLRDLRTRKVSPKVAEAAVNAAYSGTNERELVLQFVARKFRGKNLNEWLKEEKNLANAYRRLRYAGFSHGASTGVLMDFAKGRATFLDTLEDEPLEAPEAEAEN